MFPQTLMVAGASEPNGPGCQEQEMRHHSTSTTSQLCFHWTDASVPTLQHQVETLGPKSGERAITGTGADLRKLSMEDSKRQLMSMGMSEEEVARALFVLTFCLWHHCCHLLLLVMHSRAGTVGRSVFASALDWRRCYRC